MKTPSTDPIAAQFESMSSQLHSLSLTCAALAELFEALAKRSRPDILTETQMAEHLGVTKRTMESRRVRSWIKAGVCVKVDGHWVYSLSRYEAWIESQWIYLGPPVDLDVKNKRRASFQKPRTFKPLV